MSSLHITVERRALVSSRKFEDILASVNAAIVRHLTSYLGGYGNPEALEVARDLDTKVAALMTVAAG